VQPSARRLLWDERCEGLSQPSDKRAAVSKRVWCNLHRTRRCATEPVDAVGDLSGLETTCCCSSGDSGFRRVSLVRRRGHADLSSVDFDTGVAFPSCVLSYAVTRLLRGRSRASARASRCPAALLHCLWHLVTFYIFIVKLNCTVFVVFILILRKLTKLLCWLLIWEATAQLRIAT